MVLSPCAWYFLLVHVTSTLIMLVMTHQAHLETYFYKRTQNTHTPALKTPPPLKITPPHSPDVLPPAVMKELARLQDRIDTFPTADARAMVEAELGQPIEELFSEWDDVPVAAASLAQVYKARLRSTGELVAVKVQRPDALSTISKVCWVCVVWGCLNGVCCGVVWVWMSCVQKAACTIMYYAE